MTQDLTNAEKYELFEEVLASGLVDFTVEPIVEEHQLAATVTTIVDTMYRHEEQVRVAQETINDNLRKVADDYVFHFFWFRHEDEKRFTAIRIRRLVRKDFRKFGQHTFPPNVNNRILRYIHEQLYLLFGVQ